MRSTTRRLRGGAEALVVELASAALTSPACSMTDQRVASVGCAVSVRSSRRSSIARAAAFDERSASRVRRLGQRLALRRALGALVAAPPAHALAGLGEVGEVELHRARADDVERSPARISSTTPAVSASAPGSPARRGGRVAQRTTAVRTRLAALARDRLLEQPGQQPRVAIEPGDVRASAIVTARELGNRGSSARRSLVGDTLSRMAPCRTRRLAARRARAAWVAVRLLGLERGFPLVPLMAFTPFAAVAAAG